MGSHFAAYEALYKQIDPAGVNQIGAMDAAAFLKRSALPDAVLRDIWELADPDRKGCVSEFVAKPSHYRDGFILPHLG